MTALPLKNLTTNQRIAIGSIGVSLLRLFYKREELKAAFHKKPAPLAAEIGRFEEVPALQPKRGLCLME